MYINNIKETQDNEGKIIRIDIQISGREKTNICNKYIVENELCGLIFYNNDKVAEFYLSINENSNLILLERQIYKDYNRVTFVKEFEQIFTKIYE